MQLEHNERFHSIWTSLGMKIRYGGFARLGQEWQTANVCSPFSRIYYIPDGEGEASVGGERIPLRAGMVYLIPAGLTYDYSCERYMEQLFFHINVILPNGMDLFRGCGRILEKEARDGRISRVMTLYRSGSVEDAFRLNGLLLEELGDFLELAGIRQDTGKRYSALVEQAFRLAQEPVSASHHVRSLAEQLHVSESTLSKRFRQETGMRPGEYLSQLLIDSACSRLIEGEGSIAQIAEELGFSDQFYFARFFKKQMSVTPSGYRRLMRT